MRETSAESSAETPAESSATGTRPNILFAFADDWGWPHAGACGDPVVATPTFDRLAREGVLFRQAFVSSPSCTASRGAILTGQYHWRLESAANLHSIFPDRFATYPEILKRHGYFVGVTSKGWGPGRTETKGRPLAGRRFQDFGRFIEEWPPDAPFCFWLGTKDPHRPYQPNSGAESGMDLSNIRLPACFPDTPVIRSDVADYYFEVERFDRLVGRAVDALEAVGELDNTIIVMSGDHGMPFPRCKSHLYDTGTRVPLAIRWGARCRAGRTIDDLVSLTDLAPTFLEVARIDTPGEMTGRSLLPILESDHSGVVGSQRDHVLFGKERHVPAQESPDWGGYPSRAIRTADFLYIKNYRPDRWPAGTPDYKNATVPGAWYADTDPGPTKRYMVENCDQDATHRRLYELAFAKRSGEELYDLRSDPDQLKSVADAPKYAADKARLRAKLMKELSDTGDPRADGGGDRLDQPEYFGGAPKHPDWEKRGP